LICYLDSSFLVSLYVDDIHSNKAMRALEKDSPDLLISWMSQLEVTSAIRQLVFRNTISDLMAEIGLLHFGWDIAANVYTTKAVSEDVFQAAGKLADIHTSALGPRTYDVLHVAAALHYRADAFWTFDDRQAKLAKAVGLKLLF